MARARIDRPLAVLLTAAAVLFFSLPLRAQQGPDDPVTTAVRRNLDRYGKWIVASARQMPADKYSFRPDTTVRTFGEMVKHVARSNDFMCSAIGGMQRPDRKDVATTDKEGLVSVLESSFELCRKALGGVDDSKLSESIPFFGGRKMPRAAVMVALPADLADHYSRISLALRMNGMLPPSAGGHEM